MYRLLLPVFLASLLIVTSCSRQPLDVDISGVQVKELTLLRLDQDLFTLNGPNFEAGSYKIKARYGTYYEHYLMGFIVPGGTPDSAYRRSVLAFTGDKDVRTCQAEVQKLYPQDKLDRLLPEINGCVKRFNYHFPERPTPARLITCLSGWNYAFAYMDSALTLSLDMYLGERSPFYDMLQYPQYQRKRMTPDYLLTDLARGWLLTEYDNVPAENTLLHHTIFYGKLYYGINALLPYTHDSLLIGYSGKQLAYCRQYEKQLWSYFAENNRLFENDPATVRELTSEGPFTGAISKDCPPRIAMWVGLQIVRSYMKKNPSTTLAELMSEPNAQKILSASKYRP